MSSQSSLSGAVDGSWTNPRLATGVGVVGVVIGAFLPWVSVSLPPLVSETVNGIDADGVITLIVAVVVGAAIVWKWTKVTQILSVIGGLVAAGLGLLYITDPLAGVDFDSASGEAIAQEAASPEIGLYVTAIGGVILLVGGILGLLSD